ncbi:uncharacterized protein LOC128990775 [Macrosteles quadrilineatus]|uniref:uncharacterized protein LOC128990361 n=1 Tax=Macrosteles quadrilineatus TaxID=74068 RepID=UPI0023E23752|nr:uncharacterized protein LOC128990361 [Macrosteles quadrilineatus]XP_054269327.1 uncharacterized protein LOC128990775 [Macrosteles quadrilineatus]
MLTREFSNNSLSETPIHKKMDSNRNHLRRIASHKDTEFSNQSVMKAIETFVEAVQEMDQTILVPSRLMDMQVGDGSDVCKLQVARRSDCEPVDKTNLHSLYNLVNCVKKELLWSSTESRQDEEAREALRVQPYTVTPSHKGHIRRPSTASMASTNSTASTLSDTDSEAGLENDSGVEGETESTKPTYTQTVEDSFRRHLYGLQRCLEQMTEAAGYLTKRYQNELDGTV